MIYFIVPGIDTESIPILQERLGPPLDKRIAFIPYEDLATIARWSGGTYIFGNFHLVSPAEKEIAECVASQLQSKLPSVKILNFPGRTLGRFELLESMNKAGINKFRAFEVTENIPDDIRYPVFVREREQHSGNQTPLIHSRADLLSSIEELTNVRGFDGRKLLIVEYIHTADETGLFRKYCAMKIGDEIIPRALKYGYEWMVKHNLRGYTNGTDQKIEYWKLDEEKDYLEGRSHDDFLRRVYSTANVDYGRIDYSMLDGKPQIWEINTHPGLTSRLNPEEEELREKMKELRRERQLAFFARVRTLFSEMDQETESSEVVEITIPDELARRVLAFRKRARRHRRNDHALKVAGMVTAKIFPKTRYTQAFRKRCREVLWAMRERHRSFCR